MNGLYRWAEDMLSENKNLKQKLKAELKEKRELEQRLAAAESDTRTEPVRNIDKIRSLVTELRGCRKRGLGELWDLCETAADQIEAIVAGDWS